MRAEKQSLAGVIQDAIEKGATTVEEIHKAVADLPLKILEDSDLLKESAKEARRLQDLTIGRFYDLIREINEKVGTLASELLAEASARRAERHEMHDKRAASRPAAH